MLFPSNYAVMKADAVKEGAGSYQFTNTGLFSEWRLWTMHGPLRESAQQLQDPIVLWLSVRATLPRLFDLARAVLAIAATSTPVERMWNKTKRVYAKLRGSLHPETGAKQVYVRDVWDWQGSGGAALMTKYEARFAKAKAK